LTDELGIVEAMALHVGGWVLLAICCRRVDFAGNRAVAAIGLYGYLFG